MPFAIAQAAFSQTNINLIKNTIKEKHTKYLLHINRLQCHL
jgi:hypothetical protein